MNEEPQDNRPDEKPDNDSQNKINFDDDGLRNKLNPVISPVAAGFIGLFAGFFLYQIVGGLLTLLIFGLDVEKAPANSLRLMTMAGQVLFILLPALLFSKWFYEDVTRVIRFKRAKWQEIGLFTVGIIILTPLLENYIIIQNYFIEKLAASSSSIHTIKIFFDNLNDKVESTYSNLLTIHNVPEALLVILVVAAVPAICEEVLFRGFIQKSFELKLRPVWAILITSIFFGVYHFNPYGLIPLIGLGFYFGFAVYKSDSIFVSMALHFLNNFAAIMVFFFVGRSEVISPDKPVDLGSSITIFVILLGLFSAVIYMILNYYKKIRKD